MPSLQQRQQQGRFRWRRFSRRQGVIAFVIIAFIALALIVVIQVLSSPNVKVIPEIWATISTDIIGGLAALFALYALIPVIFPAKDHQVQENHIPFMVEDLPGNFVQRPREFEELIARLLDQKRRRPIAITAALRGAGGYGKTTMAKALCHDQRIRRAFRDGILWVTLGENLTLDKLVGKVEDLIYNLNHERPGFTGLDTATARLAGLLDEHAMLLVVDDVWNPAHLKPFQQGGKRCTRLITTRDDSVLPPDAQCISVDAMQQQEAVQLLRAGLNGVPLSASDSVALHSLAARLGECPLLLKLANGALRKQILRNNQTFHGALTYVNQALDEHGLTAFDARNAQDRSQAVAQTLGVSFELLSKDEYARYRELAVFPEDVNIPLATLQKLWRATGGLNEFGVRELCEHLFDLSLLLNFDLATRTIRLHDVVRAYLGSEVGEEGLVTLHGQLLDAYGIKRWAELSHEEPYLWDHLADHLLAAGRSDELVATVKDLRYLAAKACARNGYAVEADLNKAESQAPADVPLRLLNRCRTYHEIAAVLYSRLEHVKELSHLCQAFEPDIPRPYLASWHPLPDLPDPALIRTLRGHTDRVHGCAISPAGDSIVSASFDRTLKVWDAHTGACLSTLYVNGRLYACTFHPDGEHLVAAGAGGVYFLRLVR
jgi:NB-ARC domain/WD domain, G-beta repeat